MIHCEFESFLSPQSLTRPSEGGESVARQHIRRIGKARKQPCGRKSGSASPARSRRVVTVKNDLGERLELFSGDIETPLAIGLVGPYLTSRMNPIAEAIRLSLQRMKVTALRLKALSPEEYKSLFDEETLDQIYKRLTQYEKDLMTRKLVWHWKT